MKLVYEWLRELVPVTADVQTTAKELGLRVTTLIEGSALTAC